MSTTKIKIWTRKFGAWVLAAGLFALTGCQTPAELLEPSAVEQVKEGVTSRQQVLHDFGQPEETHNGRNTTLLIYRQGYLGSSSDYGPTEDSTLTLVSFLFGADDRLLRKHYSFHKVQTFFSPAGITFGNGINDDLVAKVRPNLTTRQEAERLLGEPTAEVLLVDGTLEVDWIYQDVSNLGGQRSNVFRVLFNDANIALEASRYQNH
jgi:outer membrane protein assembly factor BamE (lipoprotein component of BamABCDE complex)